LVDNELLLNRDIQVEQGKGKQADHLRAIEHFLQAHSIASAVYIFFTCCWLSDFNTLNTIKL